MMLYDLLMQNLVILISLFTLGLFGGFSHCIGMCGPFVLTQVGNRLKNIEIGQATEFKKLQGCALLPYHLGRITTYSLTGGISSFLLYNLKEASGFKILSGILLMTAALVFTGTALKFRLPFRINFIKNLPSFDYPFFGFFRFIKKTIGLLFLNPYKFNGYFLGVILGFIPCGLLYGAIAAAASIDNYIIASLGMFLFGIATIPSLFITACGGYLFFKKINLKLFADIMLLLNAITLFIMAISLILNKI